MHFISGLPMTAAKPSDARTSSLGRLQQVRPFNSTQHLTKTGVG
ncbi:hypothetical protein DSUL_50261 [Desulfovibrionales bacterium]